MKLFNSLIQSVLSMFTNIVDSIPSFSGSTATFISYIGFVNKFFPVVELFVFIGALVAFAFVIWVLRIILKAIPGIW